MSLRGWFRFGDSREQPEEPPRERLPGELTDREVATINELVSILETGHPPGPESYSSAQVLRDGAGISYGIHQATARSGSLLAVLEAYYAAGAALKIEGRPLSYADASRIALSSVAVQPDKTSAETEALMSALRRAGEEPTMQAAQREAFDRLYWRPVRLSGELLKLRRPLSYAVLYDCAIQSGQPEIDKPLTTGFVSRIRPSFPELPPSKGGGERVWIVALLAAREKYLLSRALPVQRASVYRVHVLQDLCDAGLWDLEVPFTIRIDRPSGRADRYTIGRAPPRLS